MTWDKGAMDDEGVRERCKGMTQQGCEGNGSCLHDTFHTTNTLPTPLQKVVLKLLNLSFSSFLPLQLTAACSVPLGIPICRGQRFKRRVPTATYLELSPAGRCRKLGGSWVEAWQKLGGIWVEARSTV